MSPAKQRSIAGCSAASGGGPGSTAKRRRHVLDRGVLAAQPSSERRGSSAIALAHDMSGEAAIERVRRIHPRAGQAEIAADMPGAAVQKARRADIGKEADPGLRHREERALGRDR